ncbi:hypothetical protein V3C99_016544 [Haemonchus contortus]
MDLDRLDLFEDYYLLDPDEDLLNNVYFEDYQWGISHQIGQCISGCFSSVRYTIGKLLLATSLQRLVTVINVPTWAKHLLCVFLGLIILPDWIQRNDVRMAIIFGLPLLLLFLLQTPLPAKGEITICACILSIVCIQYFLPAHDFLAIRGILMIFAMKVSALAFDRGSNCETKDILPILAYMFGPATSVFGPFHTFDDYVKSLNHRTVKEEVLSVLHSMVLVAVAFCFLSYSSCIGILLPDGSILTDYVTAQSFRTSHYFVCMLSEGLVLLSGIKLSTCSPISVEVPRSLVEVVVAWNIPMHRFLHTYVYSNFISFGNALSILVSFAVSSLLHGFNFQISAVLLSLGFACYFENSFRNRLSRRFSMCVRARPCRNCNHKRKSGQWQTLFINVLFFAVSVYQLIYLGAPFDGEGAEIGYEMSHTIATWRRHRFFGHGITAGIAVLSFCI